MKVTAGKSAPFKTAPEGSIETTGWMSSEGEPVPRLMTEWDPATDLELFEDLTIDAGLVRDSCGLGPDSRLVACPIWLSSSTRIRGTGEPQPFELGTDMTRLRLSVLIPGRMSGGRLDLHTVVQVQRAESESLLSPALGDVIWSNRQRTLLEGDATRFPINVVDFEEIPGLASDSYWTLSWPGRDFAEPFGASMRLLINKKHKEIVEAVTTKSELQESLPVRRHIQVDVARNLISIGLGSDQFLADHDQFEEGSVGEAISLLIKLIWGDLLDPLKLKALRDTDPQQLEVVLQSKLMAGFET